MPIFIFPRNRVAQIYLRALGSLSVSSYSYNSQGYGGSILSCLHEGNVHSETIIVLINEQIPGFLLVW
jgi:hypothetical protein